jgi:hypothetical protein
MDEKRMKINKLKSTKGRDPEIILEIVEGLLDIRIHDLSDHQKKMLRDQYLENLRDGLMPKEAMERALQIVLCFN